LKKVDYAVKSESIKYTFKMYLQTSRNFEKLYLKSKKQDYESLEKTEVRSHNRQVGIPFCIYNERNNRKIITKKFLL